ncbi:MAG: family 16 glycoside hydrolase [Candidatus Micrarchaeota archaeon]
MEARRGQTAIEYVMIVGGAILFVVLVVLIIRSGVIARATTDVEQKSGDYLDKYGRPYLFFDDFGSIGGTNSKWNNTGGVWLIQNGKLVVPAVVDASIYTRSVFTNFTMEFKAQRTAGTTLGVRFRRRGTSYYQLEVNPGISQMTLTGNGVFQSASDAAIAAVASSEVRFSIRAYGDIIQVFVNGNLLIDTIDPAPLLSGQIGLYADAGTQAQFDDVRVYSEE